MTVKLEKGNKSRTSTNIKSEVSLTQPRPFLLLSASRSFASIPVPRYALIIPFLTSSSLELGGITKFVLHILRGGLPIVLTTALSPSIGVAMYCRVKLHEWGKSWLQKPRPLMQLLSSEALACRCINAGSLSFCKGGGALIRVGECRVGGRSQHHLRHPQVWLSCVCQSYSAS